MNIGQLKQKTIITNSLLLFITALTLSAAVPTTHPRLLGTKAFLQQLAIDRASDFQRVVSVADNQSAGDHERMISLSLVSAINNDQARARQAINLALTYINGPIRKGHVTFGHDLARCAIVYDMCFDYWSANERTAFHDYMNATVDSNVNSETHVFHNGWFGYKNWGIGLACYAAYHENPRASAILDTLYNDYLNRAAPGLDLAGNGGGWAEGYYVNYWSYEWMFFCEAALRSDGKDYFGLAPGFFQNRAIGSMFEMYPGIKIYNSRRPVPMGDGGGRVFGGDRDKALSARRILVNHFRDDPAHQAVHAFNETTPRSAVGVYAYKDFLWRDTTVVKADLTNFKLSHISPGPGYVYARSSWDEDATYFFFKCGDRFTAHQHLDNGHFNIYKHEELTGDGGHYDSFGSSHDVNYHLRSIAHSTVLLLDPSEEWRGATSYTAGIRAGTVTGNDGGQMHDFPHHNGAVADPVAWRNDSATYDIADILAYEDRTSFMYVAGDATRAYSSAKMDFFTRQIVFIRPSTFVIFDRVGSKDAAFKKTWQLQAMKTPAGTAPNMTVTNGAGKLFIQTLLPQNPQVTLSSGSNLYRYDSQTFDPSRDTGPSPECRIGVSPSGNAAADYFLHVLTAADSSAVSVPQGNLLQSGDEAAVALVNDTVTFTKSRVGGRINIGGQSMLFIDSISTDVIEAPVMDDGEVDLRVFPNPFNPNVNIRIQCKLQNEKCKMQIYNVNGELVKKLKANSQQLKAGITWNASLYPSGIYFIHLSTGSRTAVKKAIFLK
jgi:hypothetical protein